MAESEQLEKFELELYIAGNTRHSRYAISNLRTLCSKHLKDRCHIRVIDLMERPDLAVKNNLYGVPALVKTSPGPVKMMVGDLSQTDRVLVSLELKSRPVKPEPVYRSPVPQNRL